MRVITGTARGRRLKEPQGMDIRPTTDKVKESMFSILQFDIEGRRVLDLFGGSDRDAAVAQLARPGVREAVLGFTPTEPAFCRREPEDDDGDALFVLEGGENPFAGGMLHFPELSHT